jgi:hypothetical protein
MPRYSFPNTIDTTLATIQNNINDIEARIGSSSDTRASNTVMGWLKSPIKSIQQGATEIENTDVQVVETLAASTDLTKSFVSISSISSVDNVTTLATGTLWDSGTNKYLVINRGSNTGSGVTTVCWVVVEFY